MKAASVILHASAHGDREQELARQTRITDLAHRRVYVEVSDIPILPAVREYLSQERKKKET